MCLIVVKPKGTPIPQNKLFKCWFRDHPDGFGLAFVEGRKVHILKGAMSIRGMKRMLHQARECLREAPLIDVDMIFHFRLATTGVIAPENCHPFPLTQDETLLASLDVKTDVALVHNGIIPGLMYAPVISKETDTQVFVKEHLVGMGEALFNPKVLALIRDYTKSKFVLLTPKGITYIGEFINDQGCWYSNGGYKPMPPINYPSWQVEVEQDTLLCANCDRAYPAVYMVGQGVEDGVLCLNCFRNIIGRDPMGEEYY